MRLVLRGVATEAELCDPAVWPLVKVLDWNEALDLIDSAEQREYDRAQAAARAKTATARR